MSRLTKLEFDLLSLSEEALTFLRKGWCVDEDPDHLWCSKYAILDHIYDSGSGPELEEVPEWFWDKLGLSTEDRAEVEALWAANPANEVEWLP